MNSPPPITSRANRRRAHSFDGSTTPLLSSIPQRKTDRRVRDEAHQRNQRMHEASAGQCWSIYIVLAFLYAAVIGTVYFARRPDVFVPPLPEMAVGETLPGRFNPYTAWEHLEAITTIPHSFNSRANTDITKAYILSQFRKLQAEAIVLGRRNVRYDDGVDNSTWTRLSKSQQQQQMEDLGETEPSDGSKMQPEVVEVVQGDNLVMWVGGVVESMEGGVIVNIEIDVDQESQPALLVSAHYDSVATSYGATDDGGGVAVALAMIRHFIYHPVQHTIIFNLNNAEELGLYGAGTFMGAPPNSTMETGAGHAWKKYAKAFVNMEGAGSGGPSLLFRATNHDIIRHYAENAPFPHASVFANDVFQLGLLNSDTDYTIYSQHGLPGLDIAFYQRRSMYHSTSDGLPIESLFHMGSNTQATITGLCNSGYLDSLDPSGVTRAEPAPGMSRAFSGKSVFYDLLGKYMAFSELWVTFLINVLALGLGLPVLALTFVNAGRAISRRRDHGLRPRSPDQNPTHSLRSVLDSSISMMNYSDDGYSPLLQGSNNNSSSSSNSIYSSSNINFRQPKPKRPVDAVEKKAIARRTALVALIVALDIGAVVAASKWQWYSNPLARHSSPWLVLLGLGGLLWVVNTLAVYLFTSIEALIFGSVPFVRLAAQWTLAIGVWWWSVVLVVGTGVAGWLGSGALYGTTALAASSGAAALIQIVISFASPMDGEDGAGFAWILVLVTSLLVPCVIVLDLVVVVIHMTAQSLISNDTGIMYIIYGLLLIPFLLPTVPAISRARNFKSALILELLLLVPIVLLLSQVQPFTATDPASLYFSQHYNQTARSSIVDLRTDAGAGYLQRMLQGVPTFDRNSSLCKPLPFEGYFAEACQFQPTRQVFEDDGWDRPVHVDWISAPKHTPSGWREGRLKILALESRYCSVHLAETVPGRETQLWMEGSDQGQDVLNHRPKILHAFVRDWNRAWSVVVRVKEPDQSDDRQSSILGHSKNGGADRSVPLQVVCGYDDWSSEQGYASIFNKIRTHLPDWVRMKSNARGLFKVSVDLEL
ncbi:hypothetical protein EDD21DRAFT_436902 [Dissophora ornata]|nr:hypothetical protein EDD21DRAFT_436902 [Dissophora ornata]